MNLGNVDCEFSDITTMYLSHQIAPKNYTDVKSYNNQHAHLKQTIQTDLQVTWVTFLQWVVGQLGQLSLPSLTNLAFWLPHEIITNLSSLSWVGK